MKTLAFRRRYWIRWVAILAVGAMLFPGFSLSAAQRRKSRRARRITEHRRRRHYKRRHYRRRYAHLHLSHERVRQIQEALVKAGYLQDEPDGIWGAATRKAMRNYQQANGFSPTGLPEAKPLMKLGLGPHPLPPGLESLPPAEAKKQGLGQTGSPTSLSASQKSSGTSGQ